MHSHHSHSGQYCTHATGDLEACIEEAIRQGFTKFCLTEHVPRYRESDLYPGEESVTPADLLALFQAYHAHAKRCREMYGDRIEILVGLETEFVRDVDLGILALLERAYPVDMVVGSVHHVNAVPIDFDRPMWDLALGTCVDQEHFFGTYFDHQFAVINALQPDVIGHFDVILLQAPPGTDLFAWPSVCAKMERNIAAVVSYGGLFELNASAFRKGWETAYPRPDVARLITALGGKFCTSDDSHGPHHVGLNYHRLQSYVRELGLTQLGEVSVRKGAREAGCSRRDALEVHASAELLESFLAWRPRSDV